MVNKKGWTPLTVADGVEYTPAVLKRYPEAAALLRKTMRERGLPVPDSTQPGASGAGAAHADRRRRTRARPIWDGVYTEEQARRGEQIYATSCATCHADGSARRHATRRRWPAQAFFSRFERIQRGRLVKTIRADDAAGGARHAGHAGLRGYRRLSAQGERRAGGKTELPTDRAKLREILVTSK